MVSVALQAVRELEKSGIKCNLFDAYSLPLDAQPILNAAKKAGGTILTVEDNFVGGINSALAEAAVSEPPTQVGGTKGQVRVQAMTCPRIPKSGKETEDVLAFVGLSVGDVVKRAKSLVS
jgi:transketolase